MDYLKPQLVRESASSYSRDFAGTSWKDQPVERQQHQQSEIKNRREPSDAFVGDCVQTKKIRMTVIAKLVETK